MTYIKNHGPSSLVAIPAISWATSLNRTTLARAIATALKSLAAAIPNKYVMRNIDQSNGEKSFRISPTSFNITLLIDWCYPGRISNNGTAVSKAIVQAIATSEPAHGNGYSCVVLTV